MSDFANGPQNPRSGWEHAVDESIGLPEAVDRLRGLTHRLDVIARWVLLMTLLNLGGLTWAALWANGQLTVGNRLLVVAPPLLFGALALFSLALFDRARRQGNMLFEAISEELQWRFQRDLATSDNPQARPPLYARLALREFTSSSELPLFPHPVGIPIFATLNLVIAVFGVWMGTVYY